VPNRQEGFEQPSDAAFANYLFISKGSLTEVIARLRQARSKNHITEADLEQCERLAQDLAPMLGGFIRYLHLSGFKDRGRYKLQQIKDPSPSDAIKKSRPDDSN
jgi:hypothetical protein